MKIKVAVFFGGKSVEHEVSVVSALQAMQAMNEDKYEVIPVYMPKTGGVFYSGSILRETEAYRDIPSLLSHAAQVCFSAEGERIFMTSAPGSVGLFGKKIRTEIDVAFPVVHGTNVEDGNLAGFLHTLGLPAVGCDVLSAALGMDKYASKILLRDAGIPVLDCVHLTSTEYDAAREDTVTRIEEQIGYPVIVKPVNLGSSVGVAFAKDRDEAEQALDEAFSYARRVIVEHAVTELREINCAVLGDWHGTIASECEEPLNAGKLLSYENKYLENGGGKKGGSKSSGMASLKRRIPADIPAETREMIQKTAQKAFGVLGCSGVARIDFLMDGSDGKIYLNEINTIPGSLAFYLFEPIGIPFSELADRLIETALRSKRDEDDITYSFDTNLLSGVGAFHGKK